MKEVKKRFGEFRGVDKDNRKATFIVSTDTRDRHGTVLNPKGWDFDNYRKNPIVAYQHEVYGGLLSANPDMIIGRADVALDGGNVIAEIEFEPKEVNELADKIWKKIDFGSIRSTSVGFYPGPGKYGEGDEARGEPNETYYYDTQELIEISIVNIPSNPDAIKKSAPAERLDLIKHIIDQCVNLPWEDVERLTVKGLLSIINGTDAQAIRDAEKVQRFDLNEWQLQQIKNNINLKLKQL